jgi:hypothetical protein
MLLEAGANPNYNAPDDTYGLSGRKPLALLFAVEEKRFPRSSVEQEKNAKTVIPILAVLLQKGAIPNLDDGNRFYTQQHILTRKESVNLTGTEEPYILLETMGRFWSKKFSGELSNRLQ